MKRKLLFKLKLLLVLLVIWSNSTSQALAQDILVSGVTNFPSHYQNEKTTGRSLKSVLMEIEKKYKIHMNYDLEAVQDKTVKSNVSLSGNSLDETLSELLKPFNLKYDKLDNNYYLIYNSRKELKKIERKTGLNKDDEGQTYNQEVLRINPSWSNSIFNKIYKDVVVRGTITSKEDGSPLPGVNVIVKGTTSGTTTDINGKYSVTVPNENAVIVFSFIGYTAEEIIVAGRSEINVQLVLDVKQLSEVVVIGYGQRERKDLTGAISQISSKEINKQVTMSPEFAMQGRMPGVFISNPGSNPTARPDIRIRGVGTLGFNDPLYVIDGVPLAEGGAASGDARVRDLRGPINVFSLINPNDIESISVLKDASATAIYGVRAANGVVLITTKRGQEGKARVDVSANYGIQNIFKNYDVTNTQEYLMLNNEALANRPNFNVPGNYRPLFYENMVNGTPYATGEFLGNAPSYTQDWKDAALVQNAKVQDYNISISGGTKMSNYMVGAGYSDQENAVFYSRFKRYSLSINSDHKLNEWLKVGETYRVIYSTNDTEPGAENLGAFAPPWQPLYDNTANDPLSFAYNGYATTNRIINGASRNQGYGQNATRENFLGRAATSTTLFGLLRNLGSVYAEVTPLKGLRVRGTYSIDYYTNTREQHSLQENGLFQGNVGRILTENGNTYGRRMTENINLVGEMLVGYNTKIANHNFDVILNAMDQRVLWNITQQGINQRSPLSPDWDQRRIEEGWFNEDKSTFYERNRSGLMGYMARLSYNYNSKYYLDATVRRDGSSKFGPGYKWGTFPSFAAAWRVSGESFMQNITFLSDFKIRVGWGRIGNQETRDFAFIPQINVNPKTAFGTNVAAPGNGFIQYASAVLNYPTRDLSWETNTTTNIGFDSEWLSGKIRFSAEYYDRYTEGILQEIALPGVLGIATNPVINLAEVSNKGFEFDVQFTEKFGEVNLNAGFNITTVKNRVEKLYNNVPRGGERDRIEVGQPINSFFGYKTAGIFQTQEEIDAWNLNNRQPGSEAKKPGDVIYVDFAAPPSESGEGVNWQQFTPDGLINDFDRTYLGKQIPGYYGGFNFGGDYKGFDLYVNFRFTGDVQREFRRGKEGIQALGQNYVRESLNRWTPENPSNTIPRAVHQDPTRNNLMADRFIEDAGFLRFQNIQLGYTLPQAAISRLGFSNLRVHLSGMNLFVLTPYSDLDPEDITTPTTFTLGANLSF